MSFIPDFLHHAAYSDLVMNYQRLIRDSAKSFFLFGARGTGKSTWLRQQFPDALFIDLLDESKYQSYLARPSEFAEVVATAKPSQWIVIDEVQRLPNLLNEVHRSIEVNKRRFVLCGSSARKLKQIGTNLLAGRATRRFVYPLIPEELRADFDLDSILTYGSIPLIWQAADKIEALEDYAQMYLREEIQAEAIVRNLPAFARFLPVIALFHGQVLSVSSLARDAEAHRNTIAGYIEILEDTLVGFRLSPFQANIRVKEKKHPKFYFIDSGLVRALKKNLSSIAPEEKGRLFEGWFINYMRSLGEYKKLFSEMSYWSPTNSKIEVDLILTQHNEKVAIEIKSGSRLRNEDFAGLEAIASVKGVKRRIIVYQGSDVRAKDGIEIIPIRKFIEDNVAGSLF